MKKSTLVAVFATAAIIITIFSCKWFSSSPTTNSARIIGQWKVDTAHFIGKDTPLGVKLFFPDTSCVFKFNADSTLSFSHKKDSSLTKYYLQDSVLYIKEDSVFTKNKIAFLNDSTATLTTKDSLVFSLKKE